MGEQRKRKRAREYLRVSADKSGHLESPRQQREVNGKHAAANGWTLGEPYAEEDAVSASRYSAKERAAFDRLVKDLEAGRFGADILILWESSRGSRRVGEWVRLIEALEAAGVLVYVTTHSRTYDPANARDRRSMLEDAVDSEYESAKTSQRIRRDKASAAAEGKPHGRVRYGYRRIYDPLTRRLVAEEPDPAEAPIVVELFGRLRRGESFKAIARDFAARGLTTRGSAKFPPRPFSAEHLRSIALNPAYGAKRTHQPVGSKRRHGSLDGAVDATWPPLVDAETFSAVHELLTDPGRRTSRPGRAVHELSMIARCEPCHGPLTATYRHGPRAYHCRERSCVLIGADDLDAYAREIFTAYLSQDGVWDRLRASPEPGPELLAVRADLQAARGELADWRRRAAAREVSAASFAAIEPGIIAAIASLGARDRELSAPPELAGILDPGDDIAASLAAATVPAYRRVARLLCSPPILGTLLVGRSPVPGHTVPVEQRVKWDRGVVEPVAP